MAAVVTVEPQNQGKHHESGGNKSQKKKQRKMLLEMRTVRRDACTRTLGELAMALELAQASSILLYHEP
jgi:hypothetical protein